MPIRKPERGCSIRNLKTVILIDRNDFFVSYHTHDTNDMRSFKGGKTYSDKNFQIKKLEYFVLTYRSLLVFILKQQSVLPILIRQ
jgi:hypothetical protein